jgi:hypothetical protein
MRQLYNTDLYRFGIYDPTAFSLNPLKLSLVPRLASSSVAALYLSIYVTYSGTGGGGREGRCGNL